MRVHFAHQVYNEFIIITCMVYLLTGHINFEAVSFSDNSSVPRCGGNNILL